MERELEQGLDQHVQIVQCQDLFIAKKKISCTVELRGIACDVLTGFWMVFLLRLLLSLFPFKYSSICMCI